MPMCALKRNSAMHIRSVCVGSIASITTLTCTSPAGCPINWEVLVRWASFFDF